MTILLNTSNGKPPPIFHDRMHYTIRDYSLYYVTLYCCAPRGLSYAATVASQHGLQVILRKTALIIIIIIIINPLTARVVGAPQMTSQPVFSVLHCLLGFGEFQACPFPTVVFPPLLPSALSSSPFHCA